MKAGSLPLIVAHKIRIAKPSGGTPPSQNIGLNVDLYQTNVPIRYCLTVHQQICLQTQFAYTQRKLYLKINCINSVTHANIAPSEIVK